MKKTRLGLIIGLIACVLVAGLSLGCGPQEEAAGGGEGEERDYILIGRPNPVTGYLAGFGEGTPWVEERLLEAVNAEGGIYIEEYDKKLPVKIKVVDTESNLTKAGEVTTKLIMDDKVDIMLVMHTPDTVNPVAAVTERYEMPTISLDCPTEAWRTGGPYEWNYHAFWTVDLLTDVYEDIWANAPPTNKVIGFMFGNDTDGIVWSQVFSEKLPPLGYTIVDPGRWDSGMKDYTSMITELKSNNAEILTGCMNSPDFAVFWRQCQQLGYQPKIVTIGRGMLFPSDADALGDGLAEGVTTELWWSPYHPYICSITGQTGQELCDAWTEETGKQWYAPFGYKNAGIEIVIDVLKRAQSLDKYKIKEAIEATDLETMVGRIKYTDHHCLTPLVGGQWVKGEDWPWEIEVVENSRHPEIPITAELLFPIPYD